MPRRPIPSAKLVARAQKLKALSASPNEHEAESAAAQFLKLMREHALTEADLSEAAAALADPLVERRSYLDGLRVLPYEEKGAHVYQVSAWKRQLFMAVADYFGLRWSYVPGTAIMTFYGHRSDVDAAGDLYGTCARQIDRQCKRWLAAKSKEREEVHGRWGRLDPGEARTMGFEFRESAVTGLRAKFDDLTRESASEEETAEAHALVMSRRQKVSNWVDVTYTFKKGTGEGLGGDKGWNGDGYAAGKKLRLTDDDALPGDASARITAKSRLLGAG